MKTISVAKSAISIWIKLVIKTAIGTAGIGTRSTTNNQGAMFKNEQSK
jgi:hypothetical protein